MKPATFRLCRAVPQPTAPPLIPNKQQWESYLSEWFGFLPANIIPTALHTHLHLQLCSHKRANIGEQKRKKVLSKETDCSRERSDVMNIIVCDGLGFRLPLLLLGAELPLVESFGLLNDLFHFPRSWTQAIQFLIFIWQMSCVMLSSHLYLGLPCDLLVRGFHLNIFLTVLVSGILCM